MARANGVRANAMLRNSFEASRGGENFDYAYSFTSWLTRREGRLHVRRIDLLVEIGMQLLLVEFALPPRDHHARDTIAAKIRQRATFAHELVDAQNDGHAGHQTRINTSQRTREGAESRSGNAGGRLRGQHRAKQDGYFLAERQIKTNRFLYARLWERHVYT